MNLKIKIKNKEYNIEILEEESEVKIKVEGKEFAFPIEGNNSTDKFLAPQMNLPKKDFSIKEIKAVMAGNLSDIFVKEGDTIKEGQKLFILSAMKMENEIIAEMDGKIKKILFKVGDQIREGDILITLV